MIAYGVCKSCNNHITIAEKVRSRSGLSIRIGPSIKKGCTRCGVSNTFELHQIKGKLSKRIRIAVLEVTIVGVLLAIPVYLFATSQLQMFIFFMIYLTLAITYFMYTRKNISLVKDFNRR